MKRNQLTIRRSTRVGHWLHSDIMLQKTAFSELVVRYIAEKCKLRNLVNMYQTDICFARNLYTTVHARGKKTISIRMRFAQSERLSLCTAVAHDGTKLSLFAILKVKPINKVDKSVNSITSDRMVTIVQKIGWIDDRIMYILFEKIWKPFFPANEQSDLLLDHFKCHTKQCFVDVWNKLAHNTIQDEMSRLFYTKLTSYILYNLFTYNKGHWYRKWFTKI